jgi:hypothetical protein
VKRATPASVSSAEAGAPAASTGASSSIQPDPPSAYRNVIDSWMKRPAPAASAASRRLRDPSERMRLSAVHADADSIRDTGGMPRRQVDHHVVAGHRLPLPVGVEQPDPHGAGAQFLDQPRLVVAARDGGHHVACGDQVTHHPPTDHTGPTADEDPHHPPPDRLSPQETAHPPGL